MKTSDEFHKTLCKFKYKLDIFMQSINYDNKIFASNCIEYGEKEKKFD